jgi:hypothetical protein
MTTRMAGAMHLCGLRGMRGSTSVVLTGTTCWSVIHIAKGGRAEVKGKEDADVACHADFVISRDPRQPPDAKDSP